MTGGAGGRDVRLARPTFTPTIMTILICGTCPRYDRPNRGSFGPRMQAALMAQNGPEQVDGRPLRARFVQCLGGCPNHGVVAIDAPFKTRIRLSGLDPGDALLTGAILRAALAHEQSHDGDPDELAIAQALRPHISAVTTKRPASPMPTTTAAPQCTQ